MFRPFPNWPTSGWIKCQRNYTPTINIVISVSVSTEKGGKGRGGKGDSTDNNDYIYSRYIVPLTLYPT
jgi:hypothetical protein